MIQAFDVSADPAVEMAHGTKESAFIFSKKIGKGLVIYLGHDFYDSNDDAVKFMRTALSAAE